LLMQNFVKIRHHLPEL